MGVLTVRKNFNFDKNLIDNVSKVLQEKNRNFTEVIVDFFQAIVKDPSTIEEIKKVANKREGSFIGMLDGKIGDTDYKNLKKSYHEYIS